MPSKNLKASPRVRPDRRVVAPAPAPAPAVIAKPSIANPPRDRMDLRMGRYYGQRITRDAIRLYLTAWERVEQYRAYTAETDRTLPGVKEECSAFIAALEQEYDGALRALIACIVRWSDKPYDPSLARGVSVDGWVYFIGHKEGDPDKVMGLLRVKREDIINLDEDIRPSALPLTHHPGVFIHASQTPIQSTSTPSQGPALPRRPGDVRRLCHVDDH